MAEKKSFPKPDGWQQVATEFQHKSDRSTALVGAAFLETHIGQVIACFCIDQEAEVAALLDAEHPLGSFSARIRAAFCLGLISNTEYQDLKRILEVRDAFANQVYNANFNDVGIRDACLALKIPRNILGNTDSQTPRELFVFTIAILAQQLGLRAEMASKARRSLPDEFILIDANGY